MEKLCWQIEAKAVRRWPAQVQYAKNLDLNSNLVM
jgi:hypothetical protein